MNLPNALSLSRIIMTGFFVFFYAQATPGGYFVALALFLLAALTDWLDGYLARRLSLVTALGKLLDPLADKIMVAAAFVLFSAEGICPPWVTILILFREFLVTGLRTIAVEQRIVIAADQFGKWKTALQMAYCLLVLTAQVVPALQPEAFFIQCVLWATILLTLLSGVVIVLRTGRRLSFS